MAFLSIKKWFFLVVGMGMALLCITACSGTATVTGSSGPPLTPPTNLSARIIGETEAELSWSAVTNASSYDVAIYIGDTLYKTVTVATTTYRFQGELRVTYQFKVKANAASGKPSEWSDLSTPITLARMPLDLPIILRVEKSQNNVTLIWDRVNGADEYEVLALPDGRSTIKKPSSNTTYVFTGLDPGIYRFQIRALAADGHESNWSEWPDTITIETPSLPHPENVSAALTVHAGDPPTLTITVTWDPVTDADSYQVLTIANGANTSSDWISQTSSTINALWDTRYQFQISARNSVTKIGGDSWSEATDIIDTGPQPLIKPGIQPVTVAGRQLTVTWTSDGAATSHDIRITRNGVSEGLAVAPASPYVMTGQWNSSYVFEILSHAGLRESPWSDPSAAVMTGLEVPSNLQATIAPRTTISNPSTTSLCFTWNKIPTATAYNLNISGKPQTIVLQGECGIYATSCAIADTNTTCGVQISAGIAWDTTYSFQIQGVYGGPTSDWSTPLANYTMPPQPVTLNLPTISKTELDITWTAAMGQTDRLYLHREGDGETIDCFVEGKSLLKTAAMYIFSYFPAGDNTSVIQCSGGSENFFRVKIGRHYHFRIRSCNTAGTCSVSRDVLLANGWSTPP